MASASCHDVLAILIHGAGPQAVMVWVDDDVEREAEELQLACGVAAKAQPVVSPM